MQNLLFIPINFSSYLGYFRNNVNYSYQFVNHKENFVDPDTGVHTQNIENLWLQLKRFKKKKSYSKSKYLKYYISEFKFKKFLEKHGHVSALEFLINIVFY